MDIKTYLKGVKTEWGKITWPDKKQVISQTIIVIVVVFAFTVIVYGLDIIYKGAICTMGLGTKTYCEAMYNN